jgi:hypothetical protein
MANHVMKIMGVDEPNSMRIDDFMYYVADIFVENVQYGKRTELCDNMVKIDAMPNIDQKAYALN